MRIVERPGKFFLSVDPSPFRLVIGEISSMGIAVLFPGHSIAHDCAGTGDRAVTVDRGTSLHIRYFGAGLLGAITPIAILEICRVKILVEQSHAIDSAGRDNPPARAVVAKERHGSMPRHAFRRSLFHGQSQSLKITGSKLDVIIDQHPPIGGKEFDDFIPGTGDTGVWVLDDGQLCDVPGITFDFDVPPDELLDGVIHDDQMLDGIIDRFNTAAKKIGAVVIRNSEDWDHGEGMCVG